MQRSRPLGVLTGNHFINGDTACAEGAIAAGCRFAAGYPITPSTEIVEHLARRFPLVGGLFIQMEDELASSICLIGAVWGGAKAMTVTSGPGMSLMQEHIGFAVMTETPCVIVNVQRGGPSTGLPTLPGQQDVMQARWGSHGDYEIVALVPNSPQECFDLTIEAFNIAERYRTPVILLMDEAVGHMLEKVVIPEASDVQLQGRKFTVTPPGEYWPYRVTDDKVPCMAPVGHGYNFHITGLTHDERGYPSMNAEAQEKLVMRLVTKITDSEEALRLYDLDHADEPILVISYGITSRVAHRAITSARQDGLGVGHLRLKTIWPFPEKLLISILDEGAVKHIVMPEINLGQLVLEVQRVVAGRVPITHVPHAGGAVHHPQVIHDVLKEVAR
ncbi:MAG: 2-oxoacid:acceptor oxidoreductase subunit alpha [Deltaproteobacteria bacterium]|nr:2-oxoacid:acceptor oxidoreductase subunit alpha [Deltaproteobacteria bacterium]